MEFFCTLCKRQFDNIDALRKHTGRIHQVTAEDFYYEQVLKGQPRPTCICGCSGRTTFISFQKGYKPFINGHNSNLKGTNNFHKNPESKIKSARTQSENWAKGMYRRWWDEDTEETRQKIEGIKEKLRNDKERGQKISRSLSGHTVSNKSKKKISEKAIKRYIERPELREQLRERSIQRLQGKKGKTVLENKFHEMLNVLSLEAVYQYGFHYKLYDFYLPKYNVLIEVDGNFYHAHPDVYPEPMYKCQRITVKNDKEKNKICEEAGIQLIRYWESDINNDLEAVMEDLKKKLGL